MKTDISTEDFHLEMKIRIDWSETDLFGHVNNVMIMKYIQAARVEYLDRIGLMKSFFKDKTGPVLASTTCEFRKPLHYPGNILVKTRMDFIKNSSFELLHVILNDDLDIVSVGRDILVTYDYAKNCKIEIPSWVRENIKKLESGEWSEPERQS